ncbi:glycosyltransferase family 2 protein [Winogradskyella rapida]|uniref:Glycosyltransferase family 2 protein n=1 Tax=Winogradskyella rapida TaxID=549701 RepID=A0ABW3KLV2_9FLAO
MQLSVVIPVYNGADFIDKSYQSILNQHVDDFEILYVDNNSTDSSVQNIQKLITQDKRVKLFKQAKQGAAPARNLGIEKAKGDYVYMFDVDDEIYPHALHKMLAVLEGNKDVDAVFGKMVKSYKGITETEKPTDETDKVVFKEKPYWGLLWFEHLKHVVGPPAFLYRRSVFDKIGVYPEEIKIGEDTAFDIRLGMTSAVAFLDSYVYLYYKHEVSTIQQSKRQMPRAFMIWPRLVKAHLPFYLEYNPPKTFKKILFSQLFQSMGRQLVYTPEFKERKRLKQQLFDDIKGISIPISIRLYLSILVILPLEVLRKIYGYHLVPRVVKQLTD